MTESRAAASAAFGAAASGEKTAPPESPTPLTILRELGEGASARVFHVQRVDGSDAILKVGHTPAGSVTLAREARALLQGGGLRAPAVRRAGFYHLTATLALPRADGAYPALLMDAPRGVSGAAGSAIDFGSRVWTPHDTLGLASDLGEALAEAHAGGIAHGDVKPSNILSSADAGRAWLIDFGLATDISERDVHGATPRYLARGDRDLGDARARDLLALGVVLVEALSAPTRAAPNAVESARAACRALPTPLDEICSALLVASPEMRARAAWVAERAARARGGVSRSTPHAGDEVAIANAYVRAHAIVLSTPHRGPDDEAAPWLAALCSFGRELAEFERRHPVDASQLPCRGALHPLDLGRWIETVVGGSSLHWPIARLASFGEVKVARAMLALVRRGSPDTWTVADFLRALDASELSAVPTTQRLELTSDPRADAAHIAFGLSRTPAEPSAIHAVESDPTSPLESVMTACRALRLRGEVGRAVALANRLATSADPSSIAEAAELHRRSGDPARAQLLASRVAEHPLARATLARILLDQGDALGASRALQDATGVAALEVAALAKARLGDPGGALDALSQAEGLSIDAEQRARLYGARGYVLAATDGAAAYRAYRSAADHAASASALLEEATYLTGVGATGTDEGFLEDAAKASARAARIWDHLGHTPRAARANLNAAAAHATAGLVHEARELSRRAIELAGATRDLHAVGYAWCVLSDVEPAGSIAGKEAAAHALATFARRSDAQGHDLIRVRSRAVKHGLLDEPTIAATDDLALAPSSHDDRDAAAMEWIDARLTPSLPPPAAHLLDRFITRALSLIDARAPVGSKGPMLARAVSAARERGRGEAALKLAAALASTADRLLERAGTDLAASCEHLDWVVSARLARTELASGPLAAEQMQRLEQLVRSLGADVRLSELLRNVLDALVVWTGVERGLLLLRSENRKLVPKIARNLAQRDLRGEQLHLSMSLASLALERLEPVVAVDASTDLPDMHASVHALRLRSVLAVPLVSQGTCVGVVYLDDRVRRGAFGDRELAWVRTLATLAATMVARALTEARLKRAARSAERRGRALEQALADREARVAALEITLRDATSSNDPFATVLGASEEISQTIRVARRVARSDVPVLIIGESGSGKELFARAIRDASPRADAPFVSENCSAIPETLLESALFGHVRGAFTGADRRRIGLFEAADRGTLFLDEIGEMPLTMQTKLLRIIEDGLVRPLGSDVARKVDVRLIAATHRDLEQMVANGTFREDLFYRLSVVPLRIPPLRDRPQDIALLVDHFVKKHATRSSVRVSRRALAAWESRRWPGNVRQLENEIRRALVLCDDAIDLEHLAEGTEPGHSGAPRTQESFASTPNERLVIRTRVDELEASLLREALRRTRNNQTKAAKLLGLSRFGLQKMIKRLKLDSE